MLNKIQYELGKQFDQKLVDELLAAYQEAKTNYYTGGLRLCTVEGGRFCEAAFRLLEQVTTGKFTHLNRKLDAENLIIRFANLPKGSYTDSVRLHIPRALRVIYDLRNNRDAAHLADDIDPNLQDSTLVISALDWILAEFIRLYHAISANDARAIIDNLVTRRAPAIQDFNGFLKVLRPKLKASEYILLPLYERGDKGASFAEIEEWVRPSMRRNLKRTLRRLVNEDAFVHFDGEKYLITKRGFIEVENKKLHQID